jgi:hypothetical protein
MRFLEESKERGKPRAKALEHEVAQLATTERAARSEEPVRKKTRAEPAVSVPQGDAALVLVPFHPHYSLGLISLFLSLVLSVATSLRCASRVLGLFWAVWEQPGAVPTGGTGRWWVLRLGYYNLTRPKEQAEDWGWIVDHTYQLGPHKCLLILGLRLSALPAPGQCLRHEDVEPLVLEPVVKSSGEVVYQQLTATIKKTGVPREIISDRGGDVQAGVEQFCAAHSAPCAIYAIKHKTAAVLRRELESALAWQEFSQLCQQTKQQGRIPGHSCH